MSDVEPPSLELFHAWNIQAGENIQEWGVQDSGVLVLAMAEELGEIADQLLEQTPEDEGNLEYRQALDDVRAQGFAVRDLLEQTSERDGKPLPAGERPQAVSDIDDVVGVADELDDLAALLLHLRHRLSQEVADVE